MRSRLRTSRVTAPLAPTNLHNESLSAAASFTLQWLASVRVDADVAVGCAAAAFAAGAFAFSEAPPQPERMLVCVSSSS